MRDLYTAYTIPDFVEDSEVIKSAISGLPVDDKQLCEYVLLNKDRKKLYDTACINLRFIGIIRKELSLKNTEHWNIDRYRDFVPVDNVAVDDVTSMKSGFFCVRKALFFILAAVLALGSSYAYSRYLDHVSMHKLQGDESVMHVAIAGLNLRNKPGVRSAVILVLSRNQNIYMVNSTSESDWVYIKTDNNVRGYVNAYYLAEGRARIID